MCCVSKEIYALMKIHSVSHMHSIRNGSGNGVDSEYRTQNPCMHMSSKHTVCHMDLGQNGFEQIKQPDYVY